jgi:hypothetical protein
MSFKPVWKKKRKKKVIQTYWDILQGKKRKNQQERNNGFGDRGMRVVLIYDDRR